MIDPTEPLDDPSIAKQAQKAADVSLYETELTVFNLRWLLNCIHGVTPYDEMPMFSQVLDWTARTVKRLHAVLWVAGISPPSVRYDDDPIRYLEENAKMLERAMAYLYAAGSDRLLLILDEHAKRLEDGTPLSVTTPDWHAGALLEQVGTGLAARGFILPTMPDWQTDRAAAIAAWRDYIGKVRNDIDTLAKDMSQEAAQ